MKHTKQYKRFGFAVLVLAVGVAGADADVPQLINYQGKLLDTTGCVDGTTVDLTVTFWNNLTATEPTNKLYRETHSDVPVSKGLFNVLIGSGSAKEGSWNDAWSGAHTVYLGVKIDTGDELSPRTKVVSSPFAIKTKSAPPFLQGKENIICLTEVKHSLVVTRLTILQYREQQRYAQVLLIWERL